MPEEELVKRLVGRGAVSGRADDQDEATVIRNRIREYEPQDRSAEGVLQGPGEVQGHQRRGYRGGDTARLVAAIG